MSDSIKAGRPEILSAHDLVKHYPDGDVQALRGLSIAVAQGESVAITGPSGCGKSTLLHVLGGLDRPSSGTVAYRGRSLQEIDIDQYRAREVGFVFQSFYLMPTLTALENVQIPMFESDTPRRSRPALAESLLAEVGLSHRRAHRPLQLSIGERQRVAIARALANSPSLLLADEPTGNLDSHSQDEIIRLLDRLKTERGLTLVIVTHSADVAQAADRRIRLKDGQVQES